MRHNMTHDYDTIVVQMTICTSLRHDYGTIIT